MKPKTTNCPHPEFVEEFFSDEGSHCSKCGIRLSEVMGSKEYYPPSS